MKIDSSQLSYAATHRSTNTTVVIDQTPSSTAVQSLPVDKAQLSAAAAGFSAAMDREDLQNLNPKQQFQALIIEAMVGHRIEWFHFHPRAPSSTATSSAPVGAAANPGAAAVRQRTEFHSESEQTSFQAQGVVDTADGRHIQFAATLTMQREFQSYTATTGSGKTADPLVVNFGGAPARLTGAKISFDLNSDGSPVNIPFVTNGSGFLVLDINGDGKVNDGRELFGPQTGDGFGELASYDADHNGWIDENDPVFAKLRIWTQDGLSTLLAKGIGAISTSSVETPFELKDGGNSLQGNVRSSGVYLSENGAAGTVQQVDLTEG